MTDEELIAYARIHYPVGTVFTDVNNRICTVKEFNQYDDNDDRKNTIVIVNNYITIPVESASYSYWGFVYNKETKRWATITKHATSDINSSSDNKLYQIFN